MTDKPEPVCDLPLSVATEELTGFEVIAIEQQFRVTMDELGPMKLMMGVVWAYESRAASKPASWTAVKNKTIKALSEYFADEPADPDSDTGKESSDGAETIGT